MSQMIRSVLVTLFCLASFAQAAPQEQPLFVETFDGLKLSAILTAPNNDEIKAVTVILPGSGATVGLDGDVSSPLLGFGYKGASTKLSVQIAEKLAQVGVASLRYAKRGSEDAAQLPNQTMPFLEKDAAAALALVKARFPGKKVSFTGFSEGAMLALKIASEQMVDALYLMGLPTRSFDDAVSYQFVQWPVELLKKADLDKDGELSKTELALLAGPPIMSVLLGSTWESLDTNSDGKVSISTEVIPAYRGLYAAVLGLLQTPAYKAWYESLLTFPAISALAGKVKAPVFLYHALEDAQVPWAWAAADVRYFAGPVETRFFSGLGHCFSPMDGAFGEVKTTGSLSEDFLSALAADFSE